MFEDFRYTQGTGETKRIAKFAPEPAMSRVRHWHLLSEDEQAEVTAHRAHQLPLEACSTRARKFMELHPA